MKLTRQQSSLLTAFRSGRRLTFLDAATDPDIGVAALSQRCGELRGKGYDIKDEWYTTTTGARVKRYYLVEFALA